MDLTNKEVCLFFCPGASYIEELTEDIRQQSCKFPNLINVCESGPDFYQSAGGIVVAVCNSPEINEVQREKTNIVISTPNAMVYKQKEPDL